MSSRVVVVTTPTTTTKPAAHAASNKPNGDGDDDGSRPMKRSAAGPGKLQQVQLVATRRQDETARAPLSSTTERKLQESNSGGGGATTANMSTPPGLAASQSTSSALQDKPATQRGPIASEMEERPGRESLTTTRKTATATSSTEAATASTTRTQISTSNNNKPQSEQLAASLRAAANEGKVELVRLLLKCGANLNAQDEEFGNTALHQAAWNGFSETIQVLCKHRANTSIKNKAQFTPLHLACQQGHNQSARLLLMAGAKAELKNSYGDTPLHTAARYGHAGVARILLSAKCNPNQVNKNNDTPLHIAAAMARRKLTKILMQNGAELVIKNKQNETAMDIALRKDLIEIQELIANPPPKSSHNHHHHHNNAHRDNHKDHSQRRPSHRSSHEQARPARLHHHHRKSMTNLISMEAGSSTGEHCRRATVAHNLHGLSISSSNVQCAVSGQQQQPRAPSRLQNLAANVAGSAYTEQEARQGPLTTSTTANDNSQQLQQQQRLRASLRDFHNIDNASRQASGLANGSRSSRTNARQHQLAAPVGPAAGRLRTRTLAAGLGVSQTALAELMAERGGRSDGAAPTEGGQAERPRPNSVGSVRTRGSIDKQNDDQDEDYEVGQCSSGLEDDDDEQQQEQHGLASMKPMARLRPARLRSSPTGSMRSSRLGGRWRAGRGLVAKPRRLTLGATTAASGVCQPSSGQQQPEAQALQQPAIGGGQRRSSSVSILGSKLSLVQLRKMVKRRAAARRAVREVVSNDQEVEELEQVGVSTDDKRELDTSQNQDNASSKADNQLADEQSAAKGQQQQLKQQQRPISGGRRQERIERELSAVDANDHGPTLAIHHHRAPNGTRLLATKPLAPLDDDTQLYAIPKKSLKTKPKGQQSQQQQQTAKPTASSTPTTRDSEQTTIASNSPSAARRGASAVKKDGPDLVELGPVVGGRRVDLKQHNSSSDHHQNQHDDNRQLHGPALTASDSGHSVSSSSSKNDDLTLAGSRRTGGIGGNGEPAKLNRLVSSSSDEFIESLAAPVDNRAARKRAELPTEKDDRHDEEDDDEDSDDRDMCAPGYSVVRQQHKAANQRRQQMPAGELVTGGGSSASLLAKLEQAPRTGNKQQQHDEASEACICSLGSVMTDDDDCGGERHEVFVGRRAGGIVNGRQQQQQVASREPVTMEANDEELAAANSATLGESGTPIGRAQGTNSRLVAGGRASAANERLERCLEDEDDDNGEHAANGLIRPRSVLGGANAELIAAQRSLASAAAAKVHRDRLAKLARSKGQDGLMTASSLNEDDQLRNGGGGLSLTGGVGEFRELTVKTSHGSNANNDSSFWLQHHQHHQTLVAAAAARVHYGNHQTSGAIGTLLSGQQTGPANSKHLRLTNGSSGEGATTTLSPLSRTLIGPGAPDHMEMVGPGGGSSTGASALAAAAGGGQSMLAGLSNGQLQRWSGTNSVGMSDSSPSNNGADSDNSIQTQTSGSMNTDNTNSSNSQPKQQQSKQQQHKPPTNTTAAKREPSGPFGILSRILLHNSNSSSSNSNNEHAPKRTNNNSSKTTNGLKKIVQHIAANNHPDTTTTTTTTKQNGNEPVKTISKPQANFNGSLSSSSALSSPSISTNGRSPNSTADSVGLSSSSGLQECHVVTTDGGGHVAGQDRELERTPPTRGEPCGGNPLDRLGSRSRCPIVLSPSQRQQQQSNGLPADDEGLNPPRLPPKGVLKTGPVGHPSLANNHLHSTNETYLNPLNDPLEPNALAQNGLPRVSSYTQLSSTSAAQQQQQQQDHHNHLCNYHALNRSHMIQAKYSPYLPYVLGRYSIHETCDPSTGARLRVAPHPSAPAASFDHAHYQARPYSSHVNVNVTSNGGGSSSGSNNTITNQYSPNGTNYPLGNHHHHQLHDTNGAGGAANESLQNASMVCHYSYDDSIYIPPFNYNTNLQADHFRSHNSRGQAQATTAEFQHHAAPGQAGHYPSEQLARFNERFIAYNNQNNHNNSELLDFHRQQRSHQSHYHNNHHHLRSADSTARPKSSLDSLCFMSNSGGSNDFDSTLTSNSKISSQQQQPAAQYGQRINAIIANNNNNNNNNKSPANPLSILKTTSGVPQMGVQLNAGINTTTLDHHKLDHSHRQLNVQCAKLSPSNASNNNSNQIDSSHHHLTVTQNSIYAPSNPYSSQHPVSELTVLPTTSHSVVVSSSPSTSSSATTTTNGRPATSPAGMQPGDHEQRRTTEPARHNGEGNSSMAMTINGSTDDSSRPPKLPPKTTTTTIGKLTRVSINSSSAGTGC